MPTVILGPTTAGGTSLEHELNDDADRLTFIAHGLASTEKATIKIKYDDTNFQTITDGGNNIFMDVDTNTETVVGPGIFRVVLDATSAASTVAISTKIRP